METKTKKIIFFIAYSIMFFMFMITGIEGMNVLEVELVWVCGVMTGLMIKGFLYQLIDILTIRD